MALKPFSFPPPLARWLVFEADNATGGYALRKSYSRLGCLDYPPGSAGSGEFRVAFVRSRHFGMRKDDLAVKQIIFRNCEAAVAEVGFEAVALNIVADCIGRRVFGHASANSSSDSSAHRRNSSAL